MNRSDIGINLLYSGIASSIFLIISLCVYKLGITRYESTGN